MHVAHLPNAGSRVNGRREQSTGGRSDPGSHVRLLESTIHFNNNKHPLLLVTLYILPSFPLSSPSPLDIVNSPAPPDSAYIMSQSKHTSRSNIECVCPTCTSLHNARASLYTVSIEHLATLKGDLVHKIIEADKLITETQTEVHRIHNPSLYGTETGKAASDLSARDSLVTVDSNGSPSKDKDSTPRAKRMVTNPYGALATPSPLKNSAAKKFEAVVRSRAAELGILRAQSDVVSSASVSRQ